MRKRKVKTKRTTTKSVYYKSAMVNKNGKILWRAVEMPSGIVLEEDVKKVVKFQNKNKTFGRFGFPSCFDLRSDDEINNSKR